MPDTPESIALLVLGSPRSGTSAISHFLSHCGFDFGDPAHFVDTDSHRHNPIFFELEWVNRFNERVLARLGAGFPQGCPPTAEAYATSELDELAAETKLAIAREWPSSRRIGMKDPRFCFTLPFWRRVLADVGYDVRLVWSLRSPSATIASNAKLLPDWTTRRLCEFWTRCVLSGRHVIGDTPFVALDYDRMMLDPVRFASEAVSLLRLDVADIATTVAHISPTHRHQVPGPMPGFPEVDELDRRFRLGQVSPGDYRVYREFAKLLDGEAEHIADHHEYERLSRERIALIHSLEGQLRERDEQIGARDLVLAEQRLLLTEQQRQSAELTRSQTQHIEKLSASYRAAEERRATLENQLRDLRDHLNRQTAQSAELQESQQRHIEKLEAAYSAAEAARAQCEADLQARSDALQTQAAEFRDALRAQSTQSTELQDSQRRHIEKLEAQYREAEVQRAALDHEVRDLRRFVELKTQQGHEFQESQRRHIEKLEAMYSDTERRRAWLAHEAPQHIAEIGRLRDALADLDDLLRYRSDLLLDQLEWTSEQRRNRFGAAWVDGVQKLLNRRRAA
jgi:hypothetical protein